VHIATSHPFSDTEPKTLISARHIDVSQPVSAMELTATENRADARPYFETLPRELRDCIYDLLYQEIEESMGDDIGGLEFHTRAIIPRLRFVSRQFKAEYDERISMNDLNQQLTVTDTVGDLLDPCPLCSPISSYTTTLTINMLNEEHCFPVFPAVFKNHGFATNWLDNFPRQLPNLQQLRLRVCVPIMDSAEHSLRYTPKLGVRFLVVTNVQVLSCDDITYAVRPLGTWSKRSGMQRHDDPISKHEARHRRIDGISQQENSRE
jgi:hypothetical protein